ncbi:MAG: helicase-related protein [Alistipes onderdonkii]
MGVDELVSQLAERGYAAEGLRRRVAGQREKILRRFKKKAANILVATDVAARGIDINNLTHVINYSLPQDSESYVHRIGRTGRAGNTGTAITFISHSEYRQFGSLRREIKVDIKKETLPSAQDVINQEDEDPRRHGRNQGEQYVKYMDMAGEMLRRLDPVALASLLKLAFRRARREQLSRNPFDQRGPQGRPGCSSPSAARTASTRASAECSSANAD